MPTLKNKKAILIGYGGMGKRYEVALRELDIRITHICDAQKKIDENKNIIFEKNYQNLLNSEADLVCIATNTTDRYKILSDFILKSKIENIITEKPLCCSLDEANKIKKLINKSKKRLIINSYRPFLNNYKQIKKIARAYNEKFHSIIINSPSAGLGNMGSIFFDLGIFFLGNKIKSLFCKIDKTNTTNPRGKKFKDPGGNGIINFSNSNRLIFDTSEDTGLPYLITIKTSNLEFVMDEINNNLYLRKRPKKMKKKPLYYYLFKPDIIKLPIYEKYDPIKYTQITIKKIFQKKFQSNLDESINVMKVLIGCHIADKLKKEIMFKSIKDKKKYIKFA